VPFLRILRSISTNFFYGTIVHDTGVLSTVSWLVGPLKVSVTIQLNVENAL